VRIMVYETTILSAGPARFFLTKHTHGPRGPLRTLDDAFPSTFHPNRPCALRSIIDIGSADEIGPRRQAPKGTPDAEPAAGATQVAPEFSRSLRPARASRLNVGVRQMGGPNDWSLSARIMPLGHGETIAEPRGCCRAMSDLNHDPHVRGSNPAGEMAANTPAVPVINGLTQPHASMQNYGPIFQTF